MRICHGVSDVYTCPFCAFMNGRIALGTEPFIGPENEPVEDPPFHPNCRCWVEYQPDPLPESLPTPIPDLPIPWVPIPDPRPDEDPPEEYHRMPPQSEHAQLSHFAVSFTPNTTTPKPEGIARIYTATLMCAGAPKGWHISPDVLETSAHLWLGASVYTDHPGFFDAPSINHLVGVIRSPYFDSASSSVKAQLHILALAQAQNTIELLDTLIAIRATGEPAPPIGLSAVLDLDWEYDERDRRIVKAIEKVWSVDVVFEPAAGGNVTRIVNSANSPNPVGADLGVGP